MAKEKDFTKTRKFLRRFVDRVTGQLKHHVGPDGREVMDPTPVAPPVGYNPQPSMVQQMYEMRRAIAREVVASQDAREASMEDLMAQVDFLAQDPDDDTVLTPYEVDRLGAFADRQRELAEVRKAELEVKAAQANEVPDPSVAPGAAPSPDPGAGTGEP